jgi:hypothetical protein
MTLASAPSAGPPGPTGPNVARRRPERAQATPSGGPPPRAVARPAAAESLDQDRRERDEHDQRDDRQQVKSTTAIPIVPKALSSDVASSRLTAALTGRPG